MTNKLDLSGFGLSSWLCESGVKAFFKAPDCCVDSEFAFYFFDGDGRKEKRWYQESDSAFFELESGCRSQKDVRNLLRVDGFWRKGGGKIRIRSDVSSLYGTVRNEKAILAISGDWCGGADEIGVLSGSGACLCVKETADPDFHRLLLRHRYVCSKDRVAFYETVESVEGMASLSVVLSGRFEIPWSSSRLALDFLETRDLRLFSERFTFSSRRHLDPRFSAFVSKNNILLEDIDAGVLINSVVIYVYRVCECVVTEIDEGFILRSIQRAEEKAKEIPSGIGVRSDGVQLRLSLLMAKAHWFIFIGDLSGVLHAALEAREEFFGDSFQGYHSVNLSKIFLYGFAASVKLSDDCLADIFLSGVLNVFYKAESYLANGGGDWLESELRYVGALKDYCVAVLRDRGLAQDEKFMIAALEEASRVKTARFSDSLRECFL